MTDNPRSANDFLREIEAETKRIMTEEPLACRRLRLGELEDKAGTGGQYFSTWDVAAGMVRDYANYTLYPLLVLARKGILSGSTLAASFRDLAVPYTTYLVYSGFDDLDRWTLASAESLEAADAVLADRILCALISYTNRLSSWLHHAFPWHLGEHFRYAGVPPQRSRAAPQPVDEFSDGPLIRLSWAPLGLSVSARLNSGGNPELCRDLIAVAPFTVLQDHSVVTGESIFAWTPAVSTAPTPHKELISEGPVGRLRFSQRTGQKIVVQYGVVTETILSPVLGQVVKEDLEKLTEIGNAVMASTFATKERIFLTVETAG